MKKIRKIIGSRIVKLGAKLWQPAYDKGYIEERDKYTIFEKLGTGLFVLGLEIMGPNEKVRYPLD